MLLLSLQAGSSCASDKKQLLEDCKRRFNECWNQSQLVWKSDELCTGAQNSCEVHLCTSWTEANCRKIDKQCVPIDTMCKKQSPIFRLHMARGASELYTQDPAMPLGFIHIPKNARSAVEETAFKNGVSWGRYLFWGSVMMPDSSTCNAYHVPPRYFANPEHVYTSRNAFCVTRHPYERAVSEYTYLLSVEWGKVTEYLYEYEPCSKQGLNFFLAETLKSVLAGNRYINDCHMLPQYEYIWGINRQWCNEVIRVESFPASFNSLMAKYGLTLDITADHTNQSPTCPGLSAADLTPETRQFLNLVYLEDFRLLDYQTLPEVATYS